MMHSDEVVHRITREQTPAESLRQIRGFLEEARRSVSWIGLRVLSRGLDRAIMTARRFEASVRSAGEVGDQTPCASVQELRRSLETERRALPWLTARLFGAGYDYAIRSAQVAEYAACGPALPDAPEMPTPPPRPGA